MHTQNDDYLAWAHPLVKEWFLSHIGLPTEPQMQGWPSILAGNTTLISAPTGSGKTLSAFLVAIDQLVRQALAGELNHETQMIYVSPLKALSNDIQKNLMQPLHAIAELAKKSGMTFPEIIVAVRTGDTLMRERQAMLKKPPHILVTTPESLYILLTAEKSRAMLQHVKTVIIDEIHAMVNSKRGAHLALTLERLEVVTKHPLTRIGLSATQKPITQVAEFLTGKSRPLPVIINIGHIRPLELTVEVPASELGAVATNEMWEEVYDRIATLANENRTTLVFVNTRRMAERIAHHLTERLGNDSVAAHHGSLSHKLRHQAETLLKNGELKVLVATASLELGIDIGSIDLVCQIGSPRAIAVALQRVGRAGHWHGAISKGRLFATTRDELVECAALVYAIHHGDLDQLIIPQQPLDILSQQIVATVATGDWNENDLYHLVRKAYHYHDLTRTEFNSILEMLSEGIAGARGRYSAYLFRDRVNGLIKARRGCRLTAITSGGAIPDNGLFTVVAEPKGVMVGTLDEDFAVESNRGDIILLGTTSWQIQRIESAKGRVLVEDAHGAPPTVPFWRGEAPGRTMELSLQLANLRQTISNLLPDITAFNDETRTKAQTAIDWLKLHCHVDQSGGEQLVDYILQGRNILGAVPTQQTVIAERFFDESGGMQLIIHSPFGARINKAWGLALRKRFCRSFNFELQASATDDGINIALAEQHSFPLADVFHFLHPNSIKDVLTQAVLQSPLFPTRWRWSATRSLALVRFRHGKKVPPNLLRMRSDDLMAAVFPDAAACQDNLGGRDIKLPDHPLINEAMKDALTEALDLEGLMDVLHGIIDGRIKYIAVDTPVPSVFSHEILNANPYAFLDDAPLEERRARAVEMRRVLPPSVLGEVGKLDPAAIDDVIQQTWPDIRNADELHDLLQTFIILPETLHLHRSQIIPTNWHEYFSELVKQGRASKVIIHHKTYWICAEKTKTFASLYPGISLLNPLKEIEEKRPEREDALVTLLRGRLSYLGPVTAQELAETLQLSKDEIDQTLVKLEMTGFILRGNFRQNELEWCERRILARIHRYTIGKLRKEIQSVTIAEFITWLQTWQHVAPQTQLQGEEGVLEVIKQLQGFEIPANAWESKVLSKRILNYDPDTLDRLCLSGVIGWGRFSPHNAFSNEIHEQQLENKRIIPTSVTPITFFVRDDARWISKHTTIEEDSDLAFLSHIARKIYFHLKQKGASFFTDIVRGVNHLKSEVENGLWELVSAGLITADGFDNLRSLIDVNRRLGKIGRRLARSPTGRWSLLHQDQPAEGNEYLEAICWMLLKRYGVVFRDLLAREKLIPRWRDILITLRRLEDRGEIRSGRFVDGFQGEQFALPYAVESLRISRKKNPDNQIITLSAVDPLNLVGIILPGSRISLYSKKKLYFCNGALIEDEAREVKLK